MKTQVIIRGLVVDSTSKGINKLLLLFSTLIVLSCSNKAEQSGAVELKSTLDYKITQSDTLSLLLSYFDKSGNNLPDWVCSEFFKIEAYGDIFIEAHSLESRTFSSFDLFIFSLKCLAGGDCESTRLAVIDEKADVMDIIRVGQTMSDASFEKKTTYEFLSDSLLELRTIHKIYAFDENQGEDELISESITYEYHLLTETGSVVQLMNVKDSNREHTETSYRVFSVEELKNYTKEQLDIMRNEIFASYGYQFKTLAWQKYFSSKPWYKPLFEDVTERISVIEHVNISKILEVSK